MNTGEYAIGGEPIQPYPDEPHPNREADWKQWWVRKHYRPDQPLLQGDLVFMHRTWLETLARWPVVIQNKV